MKLSASTRAWLFIYWFISEKYICDIVIYYKTMSIFGLYFWHRVSKTLGISYVMRVIKLSFANEVQLSTPQARRCLEVFISQRNRYSSLQLSLYSSLPARPIIRLKHIHSIQGYVGLTEGGKGTIIPKQCKSTHSRRGLELSMWLYWYWHYSDKEPWK